MSVRNLENTFAIPDPETRTNPNLEILEILKSFNFLKISVLREVNDLRIYTMLKR